MKIAGRTISGVNIETIVIPRGDGNHLIFKAAAILDMDTFDSLVPEPNPPEVLYPGGRKEYDFKDVDYLKARKEFAELKLAWMVITSLKSTPDLEWEIVEPGKPSTWTNFRTEFKDAGLSDIEVGRIIAGVMKANCLSEEHIEQARKDFARSQAEQSEKQ